MTEPEDELQEGRTRRVRNKLSGHTELMGDVRYDEAMGTGDWEDAEEELPSALAEGESEWIELFPGADGQRYYWRVKSRNGRIVADGGQGFASKKGAKTSAHKRFPSLKIREAKAPAGAGEQIDAGGGIQEEDPDNPGHTTVPEESTVGFQQRAQGLSEEVPEPEEAESGG